MPHKNEKGAQSAAPLSHYWIGKISASLRATVWHPAKLRATNRLRIRRGRLIGKHRFKAARLTLIVQKNHGHHAHGLLARVAQRYLALEILQKTVSKMIERALAPGVLLIPGAAVRTDEFHLVLLRIAVQSGPTRAAYANYFNSSPLHGIYPPLVPLPRE